MSAATAAMPGRWRRVRPHAARRRVRRDRWRGVRTALRYAVLLMVLIFCLFPILWVIGDLGQAARRVPAQPAGLDPAESDADPLHERDGRRRGTWR